jgi:hypothetical protein
MGPLPPESKNEKHERMMAQKLSKKHGTFTLKYNRSGKNNKVTNLYFINSIPSF